MTLDEARQVIRNDSAQFSDWVFAAGVLSSSSESSCNDLLACLKRRGLPSEIAATALYVRTKRQRSDDSISSIVLDYDDWDRYLKNEYVKDRH